MLEIQSEMSCSFMPRYYGTRDRDRNPILSNEPLCCSGYILKDENCTNGTLMQLPLHQNLVYKGILKQKMLQHEAIFRDQLLELHRLYNKQKELMNEMRNELHQHHEQLEALQSYPVFSLNSFPYSKKMWQVSDFPWLNPGNSFFSVGKSNNIYPNYIEETASRSCNLVQTECHRIEPDFLKSKCKKVGKNILDLECPPDGDINSEEEELLAPQLSDVQSHPLKTVFENVQSNDVMPSQVRNNLSFVFQEDDKTQATVFGTCICSIDLNEPVSLEEKSVPNCKFYLGSDPGHGEIMCKDVSGKPNSHQIQPIDTTPSICRRGESSFILDLNMNESQKERSAESVDPGPSSCEFSSCPGGFGANALSTSSEDTDIKHDCASHLFDQNHRKLQGTRKQLILNRCESQFSITNSGQVASDCKQLASQGVPLMVDMKYKSSSFSSSIKQTLTVVRAPTTIRALSYFPTKILSTNSKLEVPSASREESRSFRNPKYNQNAQGSFSKDDDSLALDHTDFWRQGKGSVDMKSMSDIDLNSVSLHSSSGVTSRSTKIRDGILATNKSHENSWKDNEACNVKQDAILDVILDCGSAALSGVQLTLDEHVVDNRNCRKHSGSGFCLDLNSDAPLSSTEVHTEGPLSSENRERLRTEEECGENQMEAPFPLSAQIRESLTKEQDRIAADTIVYISSSQVQTCTGGATLTSEAPQLDTLNCLAEMASFLADDPDRDFGLIVSHDNSNRPNKDFPNRIDHFEAMTLKLKEAAVEQCHVKIDVQKQEPPSLTSPHTQPRNGRTRRGRQQVKNFQAEILPSLTLLSRCEIKEDLSALGRPIEASSAGASGCIRGRRRRRRRRMRTCATKVVLKQKSAQNEVGIRRSEVGWWENVTRRRRGKRGHANRPAFSMYPISMIVGAVVGTKP